MKTQRITLLAATALAFTALANIGCAEKKPAVTALLPTTQEVAAADTTKNADSSKAATAWADIKDIAYDQRAQFFAGLEVVEAKVDAQLAELVARRAAMTSSTDNKDWDFAMKEMTESRAYLKSTGDALQRATYETWTQERDRVGVAWERTQTAYAKVKSSTTR